MATRFNIPWLTESIKKVMIKYLIDRYLGHFLYEELDLSQLDIELFNGTASIESIPLNVNTINQEVSSFFPLKFLEGFVNRIEFAVPWKALWTDSCLIKLDGIKLNFCKLQKCSEQDRNQTSIISKSMMADSMLMAEEILKEQEHEKYEGLEKFAQLISSIIRRVKLSADNTVVKFVFPQKSGIDQEIELRIGSLKCEEEEINLDNNATTNASTGNKDDKNNNKNTLILSDVITKRITLEGVELFINNILITKLYGKHTFKIRFYDNKIDMEAYFGSYIFAILNSDHLKILELFFQMMDYENNSSNNNHISDNENQPKERLMTSQDYRRIQEILHTENMPKHQNKNLMNSSMISYNGGKTWTTDSLQEDEFMPFEQDNSNEKNKDNNLDPNDLLFTCNIKIPGIMLCLITSDDDDQMPEFNEMPQIDNLQTFIGINSFLNDMLHDYSHVRLLASNLCFEMKRDQMQFSCINISSYEYHQGMLNNLFWVKDSKSDAIMPSIRLKKVKNNVTLTLAPTTIRIDPTAIERHPKLIDLLFRSDNNNRKQSPPLLSKNMRTTSQNENDDFVFNIDCENIEIELYFPIPDLRAERNEYSCLHDEILLIDLKDVGISFESNSGELLCSEVTIDIKIDDDIRKLFHSQTDQKNIKLHFSTLIPVNVEPFDENILIAEMNSMHESVNFLHSSAINHDKNNEPFQVKRNMYGEETYERIVTPGDRDHIQHYIAYNRELTKFHTYIHVPYGQVYLEDKAMFELIYNRFANDLILWSPFFKRKPPSPGLPELILPIIKESFTEHDDDGSDGGDAISNQLICDPVNQSMSSTQQNPIFYSCKVDSMCGSLISENSYHSVLESSNITLKPQNEFVIELEMDNLNIDLNTRSGQKNNLFMQNFLLGIIGGPEIQPKTVICLCSENLIYKCDSKQILINNTHLDLHSELNLSVEIKREKEDFKKIELAVQLKNALLFGLDLPIFEDLWEFLNVRDDEILGYVCPKVAIELHVDAMKSGVVFDNLKERTTLIHVEDIYLTSMVVENTNQTIFRFFIEEALLCFKRNSQCSDHLRNYISVIDSGIIDINLKISKDGRIEWKGTNNEINLKVCYDSLATLCEFLQSFGSQTNSIGSNDTNMASEENIATNMSNQPNEIHVKMNSDELIADALSECALNDNKNIRYKKDKNCFCDAPKMDESNFLILGENDLGSGINTSEEPKIRVLVDEPIKIVENHFKITHYNVIPELTASVLARYLLDRMSLKVYLYSGKDFDDQHEDDTINERKHQRANTDAISQVNLSLKNEKATYNREQRVRFDQNSVLWENIDLISTKGKYAMNNHKDNHFSFKSTGGSKRKMDTYVVLVLKRIKILFDLFDKNDSMAWMFLFMVEDLEIIDKVSVSKINKMLYEYCSESIPRNKHSNMFSIRLNCYRNVLDMVEEGDLTVSLKPLRVNIDQDTLLFLMDFFSKFNDMLNAKLNAGKENSKPEEKQIGSNEDLNMHRFDSKSSINSAHNSDGDTNYMNDADDNGDDEDVLYSNPPTMFTVDQDNQSTSSCSSRIRRDSTTSTNNANTNSLDALFIKSFVFWPDVPIRLDYHGKYIDLKQGAVPGIALGLAQLNQSELCLKKLSNKHGLLGFEKVIQYAFEEWGKDIKRNQLPSILGGVGPMHSFIQLFQGIRDLFWIPIDQYRRDQRIVRGIQRGAYAFSVSTAMATLELANRLVSFIQSTAQFAHDVVTPPSGNRRHQLVAHTSQPRDLREGFTMAYTVIREGLHDTVRGMTNTNLVADDAVTAIGQVVRQIPSTVVRPLIHLSQATSNVLVGIRNQLTPEARKDDQEKWKNANEWQQI